MIGEVAWVEAARRAGMKLSRGASWSPWSRRHYVQARDELVFKIETRERLYR